MCGKGSQQTTSQTSQSSSPDPQAYALYSDLLKQAQGVAGQPYTPYTGETVAPVNPQQSAGIANINAMQPFYPAAIGMAQNAAQPITAEQIAQYQNPWTQGVVNRTQAQFANQNAQQLEALRGRSAMQGALGGNRQGIAEAELANQQQLAQSPVIANLMSQGYTTGLNTALTEQQAQAQGAYGVANLANAGLTGANAQVGAGSLQQGTQQQQDVANYQQFLNKLGYPFQTTQWLAGLGTGVGSQMGGTTYGSGTTTGPAPSMLGQLMGGVSSGVGLLGASGAFGSMGWLAGLRRGGRVQGYADGGGVANLDPAMMDGGGSDQNPVPESDATLAAQQRQLLSGHRRAQMFPNGTPELPLPDGMARTETPNGAFHYNPNSLSEDAIHGLSAQDRENELLDLGPVSKREVMARVARGEHPLAVVERDPDGNEIRAAAGTDVTAPAQLAAMHRTKSPGHSVGVEHLHNLIAHRLHARGHHVAHRDMGGPVMPYGGGKSWIPNSAITPGHGAPGAMAAPGLPQNQGGFDIAKQGKNIGYLADALKGLGSNSFGDAIVPQADDSFGGAGMSASDENPSMFARGGPVGIMNAHRARGYADGGSPSMYDESGFGDVGIAPRSYDEGGFGLAYPDKAALASVSPSSDYDRFDTVPTKSTSEMMPTFSGKPYTAFDAVTARPIFNSTEEASRAFMSGELPSGQYVTDKGERHNLRYNQNKYPSSYDEAGFGTGSSGNDEAGFVAAYPQSWIDSIAPAPKNSGWNSRNWLPGGSEPAAHAGDYGWGTSDPFGGGVANVAPRAVANASPSAPSGQSGFDEAGFANLDTPAQTAAVPLPPRRPATGLEPITEPRAGDVTYPTAGYVPTMDRYGSAIASIESGGRYGKLGPVTADGDMAYGKYQIMGKNVGPWTQEILGRQMTPTDFLHSPGAQDAVFRGKFGQYVNRFGPEGAARAWLGGPGNVNNPNAKDMLGTSVADYGRRFMTALGGAQTSEPESRALAFNGELGRDMSARDSLPPSARPAQYTPSGVANAHPNIDLGADSKLWPTLISAGFGMMASHSPFPGVAIGEGGLTGLQTYSGLKQQEQTRAMSQQKLDLEAKKLSNEADRWERDYKVKQQQANTNEAYRSSLADRGKYQWSPGMGPATDADGKPIMGPDGHPVQVPGMYRLPSQTSDDNVEPKFFPGQTISGKVNRTMTPLEIDREARLRAAQDVGKPDDPRWIGKGDAYNKALEAARTRHQDEMRQRYGLPSTGAPATAPAVPGAPSASGAPAAPGKAAAPPPRPASVPPTAKAYSNGRETRWATPDGLYFNDKGQRINAQGQII